MKRVLITGGTGLVGKRLTQLLVEANFEVVLLSRKANLDLEIPRYKWDIKNAFIDEKAFEGVDAIVHLAGAGIADKRWSKSRKKEIISSRVDSSNLLLKSIKEFKNHNVKHFIGASAIGYYGDCGDEELVETSAEAKDFLGQVCSLWEAASEPIEKLNIRRVLLRIGIVLSKDGGALVKTALPVKFGLGTYFGDGAQYYSWIHIDDLCRIIVYALKYENLEGVYNAVAPNPVRNKAFVKSIAVALGKPNISIPAPEFALRLAMGQMADIVMHSAKVSSTKIESEGYSFKYPEVLQALKAIYQP